MYASLHIQHCCLHIRLNLVMSHCLHNNHGPRTATLHVACAMYSCCVQAWATAHHAHFMPTSQQTLKPTSYPLYMCNACCVFTSLDMVYPAPASVSWQHLHASVMPDILGCLTSWLVLVYTAVSSHIMTYRYMVSCQHPTISSDICTSQDKLALLTSPLIQATSMTSHISKYCPHQSISLSEESQAYLKTTSLHI